MPPRLTIRELEARRRRAEEGWERFGAAQDRMNAEITRRMQETNDVDEALEDPSYRRLTDEMMEEMAAAVEMMREGMPKTALQVGVALYEVGRYMDGYGSPHRALPVLQESLALLKSQGTPTDRQAVKALMGATSVLANIMFKFGRFQEAAAALEEAIEVQYPGRLKVLDPGPYISLAQACIEMGQFGRAVERGREAERMVASWITAARNAGEMERKVLQLQMTVFPVLYATLANAYEGLGRMKECMEYHAHTLRWLNRRDWSRLELATVFERHARLMLGKGEMAEAEELLVQSALNAYKVHLEMPRAVSGVWSLVAGDT